LPFQNRTDAGRRLAAAVLEVLDAEGSGARDVAGGGVAEAGEAAGGAGGKDRSAPGAPPPVVLGLPRGGVPVAAEVAAALHAPLDVLLVRKLGVPFQPELAMGAIGEEGVKVVDDDVVRRAGVGGDELAAVASRERAVMARQAELFRAGRPRLSLCGATAIVVDDGIATGSTARAACAVARAYGAERVILAAPVAAPSAVAELSRVADAVVCVEAPSHLVAIGQSYVDFSATKDEEVVHLLETVDRPGRPAPASGRGPCHLSGGGLSDGD
jgi:putative phosphoribosyl transferase